MLPLEKNKPPSTTDAKVYFGEELEAADKGLRRYYREQASQSFNFHPKVPTS